jgi:EAL domain-containing protein (putative c-di-GMP-specific phosphodiesterase class I)
VETASQAGALHALGYEHAQGYHFARPMSADAISASLGDAAVLTARSGVA